VELGWYVRSDGRETIGPMTTELLAISIRMGRVPLTAAACAAGTDQWLPVLELAPFADAAREIVPPPPVVRETAPAPREAAAEDPRDTVPSQIVFQREQDRTDALPLSYREYVHLVAKGTSASEAGALLQAQLKLVVASLAHLPPGKLVNLAVFDAAFQGKPIPPPLATLSWRDWRDPQRAAEAWGSSRVSGNLTEPPRSTASSAQTSSSSEAPASLAGPLRAMTSSDDVANSTEEVPLNLIIRTAPPLSVGTGSGDDDLIADLFDAMHELHFLPDAIEAGDFCLGICMEKLSCEAGVVHVYQTDRREFVVTNVRGASAGRLLLRRYADTDTPLASVMSQRRPVVLEAPAAADDRAETERCIPSAGMRRILMAPVMPAGRFLGAIELFNTMHGGPFTRSDVNALAYIAQHFADFITTHGVVTSQERIRGRHDRLASGRPGRPSLARA
jgi:GAF domain-containing protein